MYDDSDNTQFDPSPLGSRQRLLPRRTFKAVASVVAQVPSVARPAFAAMCVEAPAFGNPLVREADIPTWHVPKLQPSRRTFDRRLLPIGGLLALVIIAIFATRSGDGVRIVEAASISAAVGSETIDNAFHSVTGVEQPPAELVSAPRLTPKLAHVRARRMAKRPLLALDVSTPLGDLAKLHRR